MATSFSKTMLHPRIASFHLVFHLEAFQLSANITFRHDITSSFITIYFQVEKIHCKNCIVWAKSDNLARDVIKQSSDVTVMMDFQVYYN